MRAFESNFSNTAVCSRVWPTANALAACRTFSTSGAPARASSGTAIPVASIKSLICRYSWAASCGRRRPDCAVTGVGVAAELSASAIESFAKRCFMMCLIPEQFSSPGRSRWGHYT